MIPKYIIRSLFTLLSVVALTLALDSCKIMQPYSRPAITSEDKLFRDMPTDSSNMANIRWQEIFTDKHLDSLINEALSNNLDMKIAMARMEKAEAALRQSRAAFFPTLNLSGSVTLPKNSPSVLTPYQLLGNSSWEADIIGRLRNNKRASFDLFLKSEASSRLLVTELIADVANSYYTLLALDAQLRITEKTVENRISDVNILTVMKESDMVTGADVVQSQANLLSAKLRIPDLKQRIYETENSLSILLGRNPGPIARGTLSEQNISVDLKAGMPAQLLANRPDVQAAEYQLRYGYEMTNVARKNFYPSLTLTATAGYFTNNLSHLFDPSSFFWNLVGGLTQPVFNQGLNRQRLASAKADQEENIAAYKQVVLRSGQEIADAIHGYQASTEKVMLRKNQIEYLEKAVDYTMELLKYTSTTNYLDVLTSEVSLLDAQLNEVNDRLNQLQFIITLYRSLGGGWK